MKKQGIKYKSSKKSSRAIYERILHQLAPEIRKALLETGLPDKDDISEVAGEVNSNNDNGVFTAAFVREHTREQIAEGYYRYSLYLMNKCNQNVDEAIEMFFDKTKDEWKGIFTSAEQQKKILDAVVMSVKSSIMNKYGMSKEYMQGVSSHIIFSIAWLIKVSVSAWDNADIALKWLYGSVASFLMSSYKTIAQKIGNDKEGAEQKYTQMKDTIGLYMSVADAVIIIIANDLKDAKATFGVWVDKIIADAKAQKLFAVSIIRSWFAAENTVIKEWVQKTCGDSKKTAVTVWNGLAAPVMKAWNNAQSKSLEFMNKAETTKEYLGKRIDQFAQETKSKTISVKDSSISKIISMAVKKLNKDNYPLDKIIELVTKAYNESISVKNGKIILNEHMFNRRIARYLID